MAFARQIVFGLAILALIGCGGSDSKSQTSITSVTTVPEFAIVKDNGITTTTTLISGSGEIAFTEPASEEETAFKFKFGLVNETSSITILIFSDAKLDESTANVIKIQKKDGNLTGTFSISGSDETSLGFEAISDEENTFYVDVHNNEEPTHVLIWKDDTDIFDEESTVFNSNSESLIENFGQKVGTGSFIGVKLENASLLSFTFHDTKFED